MGVLIIRALAVYSGPWFWKLPYRSFGSCSVAGEISEKDTKDALDTVYTGMTKL